jgi:DNA (cytosine-5)-methyltransferase 1
VADADGGHASAEREQRGGEQRLLAEGGSGGGATDGAGIMGDARNGGRKELRRNGNEQSQDSARGCAATNGFWSDAIWLPCRDGKARPTEPGTFPLAHGATQRVGRLRAYGNAIVAPQAAEFVRSYLDCAYV